MRICVYAASSAQVHSEFQAAAFAMGDAGDAWVNRYPDYTAFPLS